MNDSAKTMLLNVALGAFDAVMQKERPGSTRGTRLVRVGGRLSILLGEFRQRAWAGPALEKADGLFDEFNAMIAAVPADGIWDDQMMVHIGLALFESVRAEESGFRRTRLDKGIERVLELLEPWDVEALPVSRGVVVARLGDRFVARGEEVFA